LNTNHQLCDLLKRKSSLRLFIEREAVQYPSCQSRHTHREAARQLHGWHELTAQIKRLQMLNTGKLWQVDNKINGEILCEGSKTKCVQWLRATGNYRDWKRGKNSLSLGKLIFENTP